MGEGIDFNAAEFYYDYPDETDKPIDLTTLKSTYLQKLSSKESSSSKRSPN